MKRVLLAYHDQQSRRSTAGPWLEKFPRVILITDRPNELSFGRELSAFGRLVPDISGFHIASPDATMRGFDFNGKPADEMAGTIAPVALLQVGDAIAECGVNVDQPQVLHFETTVADRTLGVFQGGAFVPVAPAATIPPDAAYSRGLRAWQHYLAWLYDPSLGNDGLAAIVDLSRETGVLVGATSYIVVENSAQSKMLDLKERQKLQNQIALEFPQVPEPTTWVLLLLGGGFLLCRQWRRRPFRSS